jgi:hypothetical protein
MRSPVVILIRNGARFAMISFLRSVHSRHWKDADGLEEIGLRGTKVTSEGVAYLEQFPRLEKVYLYLTAIDDSGIEHISKIATLRYVDVSSTQITDASFGFLNRLPKLEHLEIYSEHISKQATKAFRQAHPGCTIEGY